MTQKKSKGTKLQVFSGREARLNRAILQTLTIEFPLIIYDISKRIRNVRGLRHTKNTNVGRRVKALEQQGYVEIAGSRETQSGSQGILYQLTTRAQVALLLTKISMEVFIEEADEEMLVAELAVLRLFIGENSGK